MNASDLHELNDGKPQEEKKLSRQQKKILDAISRIDRAEAQRLEQKNKMRQKDVININLPGKQQKIQISQSTKHQTFQKQIRIVSSSKVAPKSSEDQSVQNKKIVNPGYKLTNQDDLFIHLIQYRQTEREKQLQKNSKSLLGMPYNMNKDEIVLINQQFIQSTRTAILRIQSKFEQNKSKLRKPNAKEHKDFQSNFLTDSFLKS